MKTIQVNQMCSPRTGNPVANQFVIMTKKGIYFQSYETIIAYKPDNGKIKLDSRYWNYSVTTTKYRNMFTGLDTNETKKAIKDKEIILTNLN